MQKSADFLSASSADGGQSSGQSFVHNGTAAMIGYTRAKCFAVLLGSPADGGQIFLVARGSLIHDVTSAPAMIGYTRKMFRDFVGVTRRRRTNVFCPWTIVQNIKHVACGRHQSRDLIEGLNDSDVIVL
jgi:hypothetical protein